MPRPEYKPAEYLSPKGRRIFLDIIKHILDKDVIEDIDTLELSMLANSLDVYANMAAICNEKGFSEEVTGKNGTFKQIVPEYTIMRNEYQNVLKHSGKYGLTPGDRAKIFAGMKKKKKEDLNEGLE